MKFIAASAIFRDRHHAGGLLASRLAGKTPPEMTVVLGLPRGGVPVACEIAKRLGCPLDVLVVRKLGVPGDEEIAFGALASGGVEIHHEDIIAAFALAPGTIGRVVARERAELQRRERLLRQAQPVLSLRERCVVLVDDGIATGATMLAAVQAARWRGAGRVLVAAPVTAHEAAERLRSEVDEVVSVIEPAHLLAVGEFYRDFSPTTDAELLALLRAQPLAAHEIEEDDPT